MIKILTVIVKSLYKINLISYNFLIYKLILFIIQFANNYYIKLHVLIYDGHKTQTL